MRATTVRLYGEAGRRFGRVHSVHLDSGAPREALAYLSSQFRGFAEYLTAAKDRGVVFAVFRGRENIGESQLGESTIGEDIRIAPILQGAKSGGVFQTILGAALAVAGAWFVNPYLLSAGISMAAGGVVQMLAPVPKGLASKDSAANTPNYAFNGAVNTQAQGTPVPLLYGRLIVGSAVVSASISTKVDAYVPTTSGAGSMGAGGNVTTSGSPA